MSGGWKVGMLGKVASLTMGQSPDSKYYSDQEVGWPFLQGCAEFQARTPVPRLHCIQKRKVAKAGAILMSVRAPVGRTNVADRDYIIGRGLAAIEGKEVEQGYLEHYLAFISPALQNVSQGSTFEAINSTELSAWPVEYPEKPAEQVKIAAVLATADQAIQKTEALIAKRQCIKTGLMQDLLTRGIDERGVIRSETTHAFQDSQIGRIPVEWQTGTISDFASRTRQSILTGPFGASLGTKDFSEEGIPVLRIGNVQAGYIDHSDLLHVSEKKAEGLARYRVEPGDLLFARQGATTGRNALAGAAENDFLINYHIIRVAVDSAKCSPIFLHAAFTSENVMRQVEREKGKGTREGVNTATLRSFILPVPPVEEQYRIADALQGQEIRTRELVSELRKLRSLNLGLMQDLLTGRKRVTALLEKDTAPEVAHATQ